MPTSRQARSGGRAERRDGNEPPAQLGPGRCGARGSIVTRRGSGLHGRPRLHRPKHRPVGQGSVRRSAGRVGLRREPRRDDLHRVRRSGADPVEGRDVAVQIELASAAQPTVPEAVLDVVVVLGHECAVVDLDRGHQLAGEILELVPVPATAFEVPGVDTQPTVRSAGPLDDLASRGDVERGLHRDWLEALPGRRPRRRDHRASRTLRPPRRTIPRTLRRP